MKHASHPIRILIALLLLGVTALAAKEKEETRELPQLAPKGFEKTYYAEMEKIKIPVKDQVLEIGVLELLRWMSECDRNRDRTKGEQINWMTEADGASDADAWDIKIKLPKKIYTYRDALEEICRQVNLNWWLEKGLYTGIVVGPKPVYEKHKSAPSLNQ